MKGTFAKFALLAAVIAAVLFSRALYPSVKSDTLADANSTVSTGTPAGGTPLFILSPTTVSAGGASAAASGTSGGAASSADAGTSGTVSTVALPPHAVLPAVNDAADLVADVGSGVIYDAVNADGRWPTASLAKLMSATIVLDKLDPTTRITITEQMFAADPDELTLTVGGTYTVEDLLHLMLLPSSNVAAEAAATFYGRDAFIAEMNARAAAWGMASTHYDDPSGISAGDQSTADDLMKLAQKIYTQYPEILQVSRTPQYYVTEQNSGQKILIKSINDFAGQPDFIGGKTGHTEQADGNLLSLFRYQGHALLIIVLGSDGRFNDTKTLYDWFKKNF